MTIFFLQNKVIGHPLLQSEGRPVPTFRIIREEDVDYSLMQDMLFESFGAGHPMRGDAANQKLGLLS